MAQENYLPVGSLTISDRFFEHGGVLLPGSRYGRMVTLDAIEALPAVTFTFVSRPPARLPDPRYVEIVRAGLGELGHTPQESELYLRSQPQLADVPWV